MSEHKSPTPEGVDESIDRIRFNPLTETVIRTIDELGASMHVVDYVDTVMPDQILTEVAPINGQERGSIRPDIPFELRQAFKHADNDHQLSKQYPEIFPAFGESASRMAEDSDVKVSLLRPLRTFPKQADASKFGEPYEVIGAALNGYREEGVPDGLAVAIESQDRKAHGHGGRLLLLQNPETDEWSIKLTFTDDIAQHERVAKMLDDAGFDGKIIDKYFEPIRKSFKGEAPLPENLSPTIDLDECDEIQNRIGQIFQD